MKYHVLLLEDITNHGHKGELVYVAPGFARNCLLPQQKAILASAATVNMQDKLKTERKEQAKKDRAASEKIVEKLKSKEFSVIMKVDNEGHMYGSVTNKDIVDLLYNSDIQVTKKSVALHSPIKSLGTHSIKLKLPEDVEANITLEIKPDRVIEKKKKEVKESSIGSIKDETESVEETDVSDEEKS